MSGLLKWVIQGAACGVALGFVIWAAGYPGAAGAFSSQSKRSEIDVLRVRVVEVVDLEGNVRLTLHRYGLTFANGAGIWDNRILLRVAPKEWEVEISRHGFEVSDAEAGHCASLVRRLSSSTILTNASAPRSTPTVSA